MEKYELPPKNLIEVKGLAGDSSDNIPGVPGVGEKTAITLIKQYKDIDGVYKHIDEIKGKLKEKLEQNQELAFLSRTETYRMEQRRSNKYVPKTKIQ